MNLGTCYEGQGYAANANPLYKGSGLKGHSGLDINCGYGSVIHSPVNGTVFSTYEVSRPASDGYTMIAILVETGLEIGEFQIGHVSEIDVKIGDVVTIGQPIGKEGNKGPVYSGNRLITLAEQNAGNHEGAHRHYQWRPVGAKNQRMTGVPCLAQNITYPDHVINSIYRDAQGFVYEMYNHENGYDGCVDWSLPLFSRNLYLGSHGYDVLLLQRALIKFGAMFAPNGGWFGPQTLMWLMKFQEAHGLTPAPVCGPGSRAILNTLYPCLGVQFIT